jgi:murein DD-endopeptidase MepM/ murein hydrolase activator NlpD
VFSVSLFTEPNVKADKVSDYKEQIKDLEDEKKEIEEEIKKLNAEKRDEKAQQTALNKRIDNLQSQINICNNQLNSFDEQIAELEKEIENKGVELENAKYVFRQRLRAIYMSGGLTTTNLSMLLSAENLGDLLSKTELTKSINSYDKALTEKIVKEIDSIEAKRTEIDTLKAEQESIKATLAEKKKELNVQVGEVNDNISDLNSDIKDYNSQINKIEKAMKEYEDAIKAAQNVGSDQKYDGNFKWPLPGYYTITSPYGYRIHPITHKRKFHKGVDISGSNVKGKPIVAAADGIVSIAQYNSSYGYYVMINHGTADDGKSYVTLYAHMTRYVVKVGQKVTKGQTIGYVGTTGSSTGYHLHFEIRANGNTTNPMSYF